MLISSGAVVGQSWKEWGCFKPHSFSAAQPQPPDQFKQIL